jgi:hypothetical protein
VTGPHDPWGQHEPPAVDEVPPLPPRLAALAALDGPLVTGPDNGFRHPTPEELPEVAQLMGDGWRVLTDQPMWCFLAAVWPAVHGLLSGVLCGGREATR